jgi:hypothetical protein
MKIPACHVQGTSNKERFRCPACHCCLYRKHGFYTRKSFHAPNCAIAIPVKIQRYLCRNPQCRRCTFSVLPDGILRYCRFFWPYLLALNRALNEGATVYRLARHVWHVGRGVILRAAALLKSLEHWTAELHQELTGGTAANGIEGMKECICDAIGRFEFTQRWYRHRYPRRNL